MPRKPDIAWKYGKSFDDSKKSQCIYCKKIMKYGGVRRLKKHLAGQGSDAENCKLVPFEVCILMRKLLTDLWNQSYRKYVEKDHRERLSVHPLVPMTGLAPEGTVFTPRDEYCLLFLQSKRDSVPIQSPYIINSPVNIYLTRPDHIFQVGEYFYMYILHLGANMIRRYDEFGGYWRLTKELHSIFDNENQLLGHRTKYLYKNNCLEHKYSMEVWSLFEEGAAPKHKNDTTLLFCRLLQDNWLPSWREQRSRIMAAAAAVAEGGVLAEALEGGRLAAAAAEVAAAQEQGHANLDAARQQ
ncbi:hypothetical protein IFM89_030592 [Coptis chinensis]|uniref:BED-type domain-containing protein n=1 Tax=Coptis chinensis TaxID=261450 RepID=A0A835HQF8_9MAGN|nr:hypothetical protein IFM89_030592 [Coptis chinensis]